jgi:hypothetical protein
MVKIHAPRFRRFWAPCLVITLGALTISMTSRGYAQTRVQSSDLGLEISLPGDSKPLTRLATAGATLISRNRLKVNDPNEAGEFTAIDVHAERDADGMRVRLSVIYNDLSDQEWWKDKKEKLVGSYLIRSGETVRASGLEQFGIEPLEMKTIDATPIVLKPGEGPPIINAPSLEVERIEKHLDSYRIWLKNKSDKNIVSYTVSNGNRGSSRYGGAVRGRANILIAAGGTSQQIYLHATEVESGDIKITDVIFEDGSIEGNPRVAAQFSAAAEGVRIQAPSVLRMIEQTLKRDDPDLRDAFDKLEADLWVIPEAIDKPSALEFLRTKFPAYDEKTRSDLYEDLKGGLYEARNIALANIGDTRRTVQQLEERSQFASAVELIRRTLDRLRDTLYKISSAER